MAESFVDERNRMKGTPFCAELLKPPLRGVNFWEIFESLMETRREHGSRFGEEVEWSVM